MIDLEVLSKQIESLLGEPFEWCFVKGGLVTLIDASDYGGARGGCYQVGDFAIAKYLITNAQYKIFINHPDGFVNLQWWDFSLQATQWRIDHSYPKSTAFAGADLPRTRVSWFDSIAFCQWLSDEIAVEICLPNEQEWQRAAVGDTNWKYPWGNDLDETQGSWANRVGKVSIGGSFPNGQSPFGVMDMVGNLWEWSLTTWRTDSTDLSGYTYRIIRGGAWNVNNPEHLRAIDRGEGHSPRGQLNDCGFRIALQFS